MNRQKVLLVVTLSLIGIIAVVRGAQKMAIEPYRDLERDISKKQKLVDEYEATIKRKWEDIERWQGLGNRTLSTTANGAKLEFDGEIKRLLDAHGFRNYSVRPKGGRSLKNGLLRVPFSFQADGSLKKIVDLMVNIYELPYVSRVNAMRLNPVSTKQRETLRLSMDLETIVLPKSTTSGDIEPLEVKGFEELPRQKRYELEDGKQYASIVDRDFWQPYKPPPPPPPKPKPKPKRIAKAEPKKETPPPPPPPPPPKPKDNSVIIALISYPGQQEVVTRKPGKKDREVHQLGAPLGEGVLRMVHPFGAVIGIDGVDYVYPTGAALDRDDQRVPASEVPQIQRLLDKARPEEKKEPGTDESEPSDATADAESEQAPEEGSAGEDSPGAETPEETPEDEPQEGGAPAAEPPDEAPGGKVPDGVPPAVAQPEEPVDDGPEETVPPESEGDADEAAEAEQEADRQEDEPEDPEKSTAQDQEQPE
jgi:hypothetical protein